MIRFQSLSLSLIFLFFASILISQNTKQNSQFEKIDILHYQFNIELSDSTNLIKGTAKLTVHVKNNLTHLDLNLKNISDKKGMKVINVESQNGKLNYLHKNDTLKIYSDNLKKGDSTVFTIKYQGIPKDGLIISNNKYGNRTFFGDNWPNRAQNWLPVVDHPSDKASVEFKIIAPSHYDVIANGELIGKKNLDKKNSFYHFSTGNVPLPTKVIVIGVADFDIKKYGEVFGIPISSYVFHPSPKGGLDDYLPAMKVMQYFIDSIGPYPYKKLANVQSKTRYGGMENAGNIFYYENSVDGRHRVESLVAHEIAHQWFGNSVTEKNWHHIWLSEGFATYLTNLYLEHEYGLEKLKKRMIKERDKVIRYNSTISNPIIDTTVTDWNRLLNPNSYEKGAWFLHMLRNKIGDDYFFNTLRSFYKKFRDGNALTIDFRKTAEEKSNQDLKIFFDQWLRKPGFPNLDINWIIDENLLYVNVNQNRWNYKFELPLRLINTKTKEHKDIKINIQCKKETFVIPIGNDFSSIDLTLISDPEVKLLHSAKIAKLENKPELIPIIENGSLLKKGDLLFQDLDCGSLCDAIESVTQGIGNAHFSHVAIVTNKSKKDVMLIEAIGSEVKITKLNDFLKRSLDGCGRPKVVVGRVNDLSIVENAVENLKKYIGQPYDDVFNIENNSYYCSELVYFAFKNMKDENIFTMMPMTYKDKKTGKTFKSWEEYFNNLNVEIPEGEPGINPGGISRSENISILYKFGNPEGW